MCLAVPGKIVEIVDDSSFGRQGRIDFGGLEKNVNLAFVPEAKLGDYVLVHVGFAITVVDEEEASHIFELLKEMGETAELEEWKAPGAVSGEPER
jgi:hydrogenase expression/formation protein HypC